MRRILYPTLFVCGVGLVWTLVCIKKANDAQEKITAAETMPITVPISTVVPKAPEQEHLKTDDPGIFYETTASFRGVEVSRIFDRKTQATCYVASEQQRYDRSPVSIFCVK